MYEEIRECYALGLFGAVITLSVIFLELGLKYGVYNEKEKHNQNSLWEDIEEMNFRATIKSLRKFGKISEPEKKELDKFNLEVRNPYIHYNLKKLVNGVFAEKMPTVDTKTAEVKILERVDIARHPYLWFSGKKFRDKKEVDNVLNFCIGWVNKVLG